MCKNDYQTLDVNSRIHSYYSSISKFQFLPFIHQYSMNDYKNVFCKTQELRKVIWINWHLIIGWLRAQHNMFFSLRNTITRNNIGCPKICPCVSKVSNKIMSLFGTTCRNVDFEKNIITYMSIPSIHIFQDLTELTRLGNGTDVQNNPISVRHSSYLSFWYSVTIFN